jgi:carotenoid cleavage dioxygenase
VQGALTRWSVDPKGDASDVNESVVGPPGDFPVIPARFQGRPNPYGWMLSMDPEMKGPPLAGGPVGAMFNALLRLDFAQGPGQVVDALPLPAGGAIMSRSMCRPMIPIIWAISSPSSIIRPARMNLNMPHG